MIGFMPRFRYHSAGAVDMAYERLLTGATAVGLRVKSGVVVAAEKRISYNGYIISHRGKKVFRISDRMVMAAAGLFADMQRISRIVSAEIRYRELLSSVPMKVRAAAKLLSAILYNHKSSPFYSEILFAGVDEEGPHLFILDPVGSVIEDKYAAIGTGATIAIGIIESEYREDMELDKATDLVVKAIRVAVSRDAVSGDGIDIAIVSGSGVEEKFVSLA